MINEYKFLFENIKNFRHLMTESVGNNDMVKYIENHEFIYIYYDGDGKNKKGYRTIRPYVLGVSTAGNPVVRAWQDRGKSDSFASKRRGEKHDYWHDNDGSMKQGWRMFRLDKISKIYPTGKKFNNSDGSVMIPPDYKEGSDSDMSSIIAYVSTEKEPIQQTTVPTPQAGKRVNRWDNFTNGNKANRKITSRDVVGLRDIATNVLKKNRGNFLVAINNKNEFELVDIKDKGKIPTSAIVGSLTNLYDTMVKGNEPMDNKFFNTAKQNIIKNNDKPQITEELPTIPFKIKSFFKT